MDEALRRTMALPGQDLSHTEGRAAGGMAMKLKLTYQPEEQEQAAGVLAALLRLLPGAKVRRDKSKEPKQMAVYVTAKNSKTVAAVREKLDKSAPL